MTSAHKVSWGKGWLGTDVLLPHEEVTLTGLDCDEYDRKLIDDEGDACIVEDRPLSEDSHWEHQHGTRSLLWLREVNGLGPVG